MQKEDLEIRTATRDEVKAIVDWAAAEGWNPGLHDAANYYTADPSGFFLGLLNGEPIASISAVKYGSSFGFMGFYIVKPEYRGQGYGFELGNAVMYYLGSCKIIGLDGVVEQQENYKRSGFELAFRNVRYETVNKGENLQHDGIVELSTLSFETIELYDKPFFPADRTAFLKAWIKQPGSAALGVVQKEKLVGYGVIRPCRTGYKIGPLFVDTPDLAEKLFLALRSKAKVSEPVYLDVPEVNPAAVSLAGNHNMKVVFETARMYKGGEPAMPLDRIFGITSFEVG